MSQLQEKTVQTVIVKCLKRDSPVRNELSLFSFYILHVSRYIMSHHRGVTSLVCHLGGITTPHSEVPTSQQKQILVKVPLT